MKRILGSGYIKKIDSSGTDSILIETIKDLHPDFRDRKFPLHGAFDDDITDAFEHYNFTFKLKIPLAQLQLFKWYRTARVTEVPEFELFGFIPSNFSLEVYTKVRNFYSNTFNFFRKLYADGVDSRQLEYILPLGMYTTFYCTMNLKDLMLFLNVNLRSDIPEVKEIAQALSEYFKDVYPFTASVFFQRKFS